MVDLVLGLRLGSVSKLACAQEEAALAFALVYSTLEEVLPHVEELWALARRDGSKADREAARARLAEIVKVGHHTMYTYPYLP